MGKEDAALLPFDHPESINATLEDCAQRGWGLLLEPDAEGWVDATILAGQAIGTVLGSGPSWQAALQRAYLAARKATDD